MGRTGDLKWPQDRVDIPVGPHPNFTLTYLQTLTFSLEAAAPPHPTVEKGNPCLMGGLRVLSGPSKHPKPKIFASQLFSHPYVLLSSMAPGCPKPQFSMSLRSPKCPSSALLYLLRLRRPAPCAEMVSFFPDALPSPVTWFWGVPGARASKVSQGVERPPPLPSPGWGGRSAPWRSWIFQHKHRPPTRPAPPRRPLPSSAPSS